MKEIVRGTTPTLTIGLPFYADVVVSGYVSIQQRGEPIVEKALSDCSLSGNTLATKLTQADTLSLKSGRSTTVHLVVKTAGGDRLEMKGVPVRVVETSKDGVI